MALERLEEDAQGDLVYTFTKPWSDGTTGIKLSPLELLEKLAALVPLLRLHLVRYGGCLAPHRRLRGAITPTPRQQGVEEPEASSAAPHWSWTRRLKRVFALDLASCLFCQQETLRIIAVITQGEVIRKILRHVQLAPDPPPWRLPIPAKKLLTGSPKPHNVVRGLVGDVCAVAVYLTPLACEIPFEIAPQPSSLSRGLPPGATPAAPPSPMLRRLSSTSQRRAVPRSAGAGGAEGLRRARSLDAGQKGLCRVGREVAPPAPRQIRTRRFPPSGSSVDVTRGDSRPTTFRSLGDMSSNVKALGMVPFRSSHQHGPPLLGRVRA